MHICPDEIMAFIYALPFLGTAFHWLRHKLKRQRPCSELEEKGSCSLEQRSFRMVLRELRYAKFKRTR